MSYYDEICKTFMRAQLRFAQDFLQKADDVVQFWTSFITWGRKD